MAQIITNQYGYKHFSENLEECIYDLEENEPTERNALALFFLDLAYQESGGKLRFDALIDKHGDALPLPLKLAIGHECKRMKTVTDGVKRMERNLRRSMGSRQLQGGNFLKEIYEVSIADLPKGKKFF
jgi:hypothetical protein